MCQSAGAFHGARTARPLPRRRRVPLQSADLLRRLETSPISPTPPRPPRCPPSQSPQRTDGAEAPTATAHDAAWKQFFALSVVIEHLLAGFFPEVAALLDFATLRDISAEWVQGGTRRLADAAWRVGYRDGSGRSLMLLLEFLIDRRRRHGAAHAAQRRHGGRAPAPGPRPGPRRPAAHAAGRHLHRAPAIDVPRRLDAWLAACAHRGGRPPDDLAPWLPWSMGDARRRAPAAPG